jgi:3-deoxy-D-manno-octulosonic-acid transferase
MYLAYSLLLSLGLIVLVPYFLFQALTHGKYIDGLRQRLGWIKPIHNSSKPVIWVHCVSVGETQAARPLVARLRSEFPEYWLVVSTITTTGQTLAQDVFRTDADAVIYFPFDWAWTVRRSLRAVKPDVVLIMETELWPNFLRECRYQSIPVALVNGRISAQSFRRYQVVRYFLRNVLSHLSMAVMQSEHDARRIRSLGIQDEKLFVTGNLKFDVDTASANADTTELLRNRFGIRGDPSLVLAASTHGPEEKIILNSLQTLLKDQRLRLMIAPRRPERFQEVANLLEASGLTWSRRSNCEDPRDAQAEIILLDTIGELPAAYPLATVVFVGGSIVDKGGHNLLEPAMTGACIVTGYHTHNFQAIVELLVDAGAIVQLPPIEVEKADQYLTQTLQELLANSVRRIDLGSRARRIVEQNQGAADRTLTLIKPLFRNSTLSNSTQKTLVTNSSRS